MHTSHYCDKSIGGCQGAEDFDPVQESTAVGVNVQSLLVGDGSVLLAGFGNRLACWGHGSSIRRFDVKGCRHGVGGGLEGVGEVLVSIIPSQLEAGLEGRHQVPHGRKGGDIGIKLVFGGRDGTLVRGSDSFRHDAPVATVLRLRVGAPDGGGLGGDEAVGQRYA